MTEGPPLLDYESGQRIGRYTIVRRLSVGGMAEVFLALARGPGEFRKFVTLKRILPQYRADPEFVTMFLEEARISASLSHANIAQVFDLGHENGELYLSMEFVPGEDLHQIVRAEAQRGRRLPFGFSAVVVRDALLALHHAHTFVDAAGGRAPVVHSDLSPRNVMVSYAGALKVIDFGIAKAMGSAPVGTGIALGSSGYMSPEQITGGLVDHRTDVFAAGVLLHELLVGRRLFLQSTPGVVTEPKSTDVAVPTTVDPEIPQALSDVAMRALAIDPEARFQSARDMARAIEQAMAGALWDEERSAGYMQELFHDNLEKTRAVVRLAAHRRATSEMAAAFAPDEEITAVDSPRFDKIKTIKIAEKPAKRLVVVAVDDSKVSLQLLAAHMARLDIDVVGWSAPGDALEAIQSSVPDAVILDVMMPEMDGFELCKRIRALPTAGSVPILFLSAACDLDVPTKCLDAGGDDFIRKPYQPDELAARLRSHIGRAAMIG